jgi:hypothetical protein
VYIRVLALAAFSLLLFAAPNWAASCVTDGTTCTNPVSPADTTAIFDFQQSGNGILIVRFDTVLTSFGLTVTLNTSIRPLDPNEFPPGTVCVAYTGPGGNGGGSGGHCVQYDFSGTAGGPNNVPVKNVDYKGLITLSLSYDSDQAIHIPAFGHAPGDNATAIYTENILTSYSLLGPPLIDPTMGGKVPNLSSVAAFDEPLVGAGTFCGLTLTSTNNPSEQKAQIEVALKLVSGTNCGATGLRDKTASLSVSTFDSDSHIVFPALKNAEGNKFHWDNKNGLNEYDISLDGLAPSGLPQPYTVTVFSSKIPPQSKTFCVDSDSNVTIGSCP